MEKAALTISIISLLIAAFSLGWNIYKDIILKPKIKLSFGVKSITHDSHLNGETIISIQGVNMGPGQVTVGMLSIKDTSIWKRIVRKSKNYVVIPNFNHQLCQSLPKRLDMAESVQLIYPYSKECFLKDSFTHFGISDSFGRIHWAPKRYIREALDQYKLDFNETTSESGSRGHH